MIFYKLKFINYWSKKRFYI